MAIGLDMTALISSTMVIIASWLLTSSGASASEPCIITTFVNSQQTFYVRCRNYCCRKSANATTQYCCSDCSLSVANSNACAPEELWRYVLYVGLGISGAVVLCYLSSYLLKNCKGPLKHNCCRQRSGRVRDPAIAMTDASAWTGSTAPAPQQQRRRRRLRRANASNNLADTEADIHSDGCHANDDSWQRVLGLQPPPPPAYSSEAAPPPDYTAAAAASAAAPTGGVANLAAEIDEPPPAYSALVADEPAGPTASQ